MWKIVIDESESFICGTFHELSLEIRLLIVYLSSKVVTSLMLIFHIVEAIFHFRRGN